jgi:hypothetical protein
MRVPRSLFKHDQRLGGVNKPPATGKVLAFPDFLYGCSWGVCAPHATGAVRRDGEPGYLRIRGLVLHDLVHRPRRVICGERFASG